MPLVESAMQFSLWGAGTARTLRPIWVAEELGLRYRLHPIAPRSGETKTPEYTRLNPKQKIPFYEDADIKLSETVAICRYLVNRFGAEGALQAAASVTEQAREDEWLSFIYGELDETSLYVMRRHGALASIYGEAPAAMSAAREYVQRQLAVVDSHLEGREYLVHDRFGLADLFLTTCLNWVESYEIPMAGSLQDYRGRMIGRPAYQRALRINSGERE